MAIASIRPARSYTSGNVPDVADMEEGEIATNIPDGIIWQKDDANALREIYSRNKHIKKHDPAATYTPGVSLVLGDDGDTYKANTDALISAATGGATATVDLSVSPETGDGNLQSSWVNTTHPVASSFNELALRDPEVEYKSLSGLVYVQDTDRYARINVSSDKVFNLLTSSSTTTYGANGASDTAPSDTDVSVYMTRIASSRAVVGLANDGVDPTSDDDIAFGFLVGVTGSFAAYRNGVNVSPLGSVAINDIIGVLSLIHI